MKKYHLLFIWFLVAVFFFLPKPVTAATWRVCPENDTDLTCTHHGAVGIQQAIDEAKDGDTILIRAGTNNYRYTRQDYVSFNVPANTPRAILDKCFINTDAKTLTLKGEGGMPILYGQGHEGDHANVEPFMERQGICAGGGTLTIDNIRIKEFQKRCMAAVDTRLIMKNSQLEGCDEGGLSLGGNATALLVNDFFIENNTGGLLLWQNASVKAVSDTFYDAGVMFFFHTNSADAARVDILNSIIVHNGPNENPSNHPTIGQVGWNDANWNVQAGLQKITQNSKFAYTLIGKKDPQCETNEWCNDFPGKVPVTVTNADDIFTVPGGIDMTGVVFGSLNLAANSPAKGKANDGGDLGATGGPCADGGSSMCQQFITANTPVPLPPPAPPQPPENPPGNPPGNQPPQNPPGNQPPGNPPNPTGNIGYSQTYTPQNIIYNLNNTFKSAFSLPQNFSFNLSATPQKNDGLGLWRYIIFAGIYIMFIHFAVGIKKEFNLFLMIGYFFFGGFLGFWFQSYEAGLIVSIILSLIFF